MRARDDGHLSRARGNGEPQCERADETCTEDTERLAIGELRVPEAVRADDTELDESRIVYRRPGRNGVHERGGHGDDRRVRHAADGNELSLAKALDSFPHGDDRSGGRVARAERVLDLGVTQPQILRTFGSWTDDACGHLDGDLAAPRLRRLDRHELGAAGRRPDHAVAGQQSPAATDRLAPRLEPPPGFSLRLSDHQVRVPDPPEEERGLAVEEGFRATLHEG